MFKYCKEKENAVSKFAKCSYVDIKWINNETNKIQWYKAKVIKSPIDYEYDSAAFCIRYVKENTKADVHVLDNKYVSCKVNEDDEEFTQFEWRESRDSRQFKKNTFDETDKSEDESDFIVDSDSEEDYTMEWESWRENEMIIKKSSNVDEYMSRKIVNGLFCKKCKKEHHKDNFSVAMQKENNNKKRYCLIYTSSSGFNRPAITSTRIEVPMIKKRRLVLAEE